MYGGTKKEGRFHTFPNIFHAILYYTVLNYVYYTVLYCTVWRVLRAEDLNQKGGSVNLQFICSIIVTQLS